MNDLQNKLSRYRMKPVEYEKMRKLLGKEPSNIEWALFSALWSEHCSYKSSKIHLKKFSETLNDRVVNSQGENAGVVDLGQGERIAFKMESHNHPSFIEPYQGAATGVGGILRDIFTMGARPIALADYLCFGSPTAPRMQALVDGVVRGIAGYGNSVGVPTVTGQTQFDDSFNQNILVNAMAVGYLAPGDPIALSKAEGVGHWVVVVGAQTGKDGVHGASMASQSFEEGQDDLKPNVQIGDPYFEKLLIESCLEVIQKKLVVAIQDMGAAGLTSSSFEMASKGQIGMDLRLDLVPVRENLSPEELLLSESQERMLLICKPSQWEQLEKHFLNWGLVVAKIGELTAGRKVRLFWEKEILCEIDPDVLVENAPVYDRPYHAGQISSAAKEIKRISGNLKDLYQQKFLGVDHSSRESIYRQYDQRVGALTVQDASVDVALLRLPASGRGLSINVGCRSFLMKQDVQIGAKDAVYYPALQMAIKGCQPIALTDCLNFGNPENPEVMTQFVASCEALRRACLDLDLPIVSGNVSFYNETQSQNARGELVRENIIPTPATGLIGLRENVSDVPADVFQKSGRTVFLVDGREVQGSLKVDLAHFIQLSKLSASSQMVSQGGLFFSLLKMCQGQIGFEVNEKSESLTNKRTITSEILYAAIFEPKDQDMFENYLSQHKMSFSKLGKTNDSDISILDFFITREAFDTDRARGLRRDFEILA